MTDGYSLAEARAIIDAEGCAWEGGRCTRHASRHCRSHPELADVAAQLLATVERVTEMCRDTGNSSTGPTYVMCADVLAAINGEEVAE